VTPFSSARLMWNGNSIAWFRAIDAATVTTLRSRAARPGRFQTSPDSRRSRNCSSAGDAAGRRSRTRHLHDFGVWACVLLQDRNTMRGPSLLRNTTQRLTALRPIRAADSRAPRARRWASGSSIVARPTAAKPVARVQNAAAGRTNRIRDVQSSDIAIPVFPAAAGPTRQLSAPRPTTAMIGRSGLTTAVAGCASA